MHLVYITEPVWFEKAIPSWVMPDLHTIVTESDTVVNDAVNKGINVFTLGQYLLPEQLYQFEIESITQEQILRKTLSDILYPEVYFSELIRGMSETFYLNYRLRYAIEKLLEHFNPAKITFIYGDHYKASVSETPRGGWLDYLLLSKECKCRNIKLKACGHECMSKNELTFNIRYDRKLLKMFPIYPKINIPEESTNAKIIKGKNTLFLYLYEMCKDDIEPMTLLGRWSENCNLFNGKLSRYAPDSIKYDFDFSKLNKSYKDKYSKSYDILKEYLNYRLIDLLIKNDKSISFMILKLYKNIILNSYKKCSLTLIELKKVVQDYKINNLVLTGYTSMPNPVIASYFSIQGLDVIVRQHGGFSSINWPNKTIIENCYFSTNSLYYKEKITVKCKGINITPRKRIKFGSINNLKDIKKNIIITSDLFPNGADKVFAIKFIKEFFNIMPLNWQVIMRGHPRYYSDLALGFSGPNITKENARNRSIVSSLSESCILVCPADCFSTVVCDSINFGVPAVLFASKKGTNILNYPIVVYKPQDLICIIEKIKSDPIYLKHILKDLNDWVDLILGGKNEQRKYLNEEDSGYKLKEQISYSLGLRKYTAVLCKAKLKFIINSLNILSQIN